MPTNLAAFCALIGSALIALLLNGSCSPSATRLLPTFPVPDAGLFALNAEGKRLAAAGRFEAAREFFEAAVVLADNAGDTRASAMNRNNVGACEIATMQYGAALKSLNSASRIAESDGQMVPLIYTFMNQANLYEALGQPGRALLIARSALDGPAGHADAGMRTKLIVHVARALILLDRLDEAKPYQLQAVEQMTSQKQFSDVVRVLNTWGNANLRAARLEEAERAFNQGQALVETHRLNVSPSLLAGLAKVQQAKHHPDEATRLFAEAVAVPGGGAPRCGILSDRAQFRMDTGNDQGALEDFREASELAARIRMDMVPADQDRVAFESGIGKYLQGIVEAGNHLAMRTGDSAVLAETFDAAEQARLWSLRSLIPSTNDWRTKLAPLYWEKLSRYQAMQLRHLAGNKAAPDTQLVALAFDLQQLEAEAGSQTAGSSSLNQTSPLKHVRSLLDGDTVLLTFHLSSSSSWLWAVDKTTTRVFPLPPPAELKKSVDAFTLQGPATAAGRILYSQLFGKLPSSLTRHTRWLLEPDGVLHDVPFAALIVGEKNGAPEFLIERASVQIIPGSLLLENRPFRTNGAFVGISDPVYNTADPRFHGRKAKSEFSLPRLPATSSEVEACSMAWGSPQTQILTGQHAGLEELRKVSVAGPSILHFATHVVAGTGDYRSGLIALSLSPSGAMDLLGPKEILAKPFPADLVVMNGCHSAQGEAISSSGRMGLTRAWLGAGVGSVIASRWDIADADSQSLMTTFYRALRRSPDKGVAAALRESQLAALRENPANISRWAGYYLLSRVL